VSNNSRLAMGTDIAARCYCTSRRNPYPNRTLPCCYGRGRRI